jgi:hypothetical protein
VPEHELLGVALAQHPGELDLPALKEAAKYSDQLVKTERGLSTPQILATELDLIQTVNAACDVVAPIHPSYRPADWLGEDQQRAIYHVLRTMTASPACEVWQARARPRRCANWSPPAPK